MGSRLSVVPAEREQSDQAALKVWLKLLASVNGIEAVIRRRLRDQFGTTLSRFDLMAQLHRFPKGLRSGELSQRLMVTGANVTLVVDQLVRAGLVVREDDPEDRRALIIRLTPKGRREIERMIPVHAQWVNELLGDLSAAEKQQIRRLLGKLDPRLSGEES